MPAKPESDAAVFFDRFADRFDTLYDGQRNGFMRWVDRHLRSDMFVRFAWTFERMGPLEGKRVVDIGCGSGPYIVEAVRRGAAHVTGVDPAQGMLKLARERLRTAGVQDRTSLVEGLFPDIAVEPHDHAIVMGVFDYLNDPGVFLRSLCTCVRESAQVSFPSRHWFRTPVRRARYRLRNCPVFFFDPQRIEVLAREAGFRTIEIREIPGAGMDYHVCLRP